jgi:eukaryotic-like serine/threonine-protein kinase
VDWRGLPRRSFPYVLVAAIGFLGAYLLLFFFAFPAEVLPDDARVPNVVGMTFERASRALHNAGFAPVEGEQRFHRVTAAGVVLQQDPPADSRQRRGTEVRLAVSAGQRSAEVPQVTGLTEQAARVAIGNAGFELGPTTRVHSDQPRGMVVMSNPPPGEQVELPGTVALVVSEGPAVILAPDLVGRTLPEARSILEQIGLRVGGVTRDTSSIYPENTVMRQQPSGGQPVSAGGTVNIVLSRFPPISTYPLDTLPLR